MGREKRSRAISIYIYIFFFFLLFYWDTQQKSLRRREASYGLEVGPLSSSTLSEFQAPLSQPTTIFAKYLFKGFIRKHSWCDGNLSAAEILECKMVCNDQLYKASIAKITALKSQRQPRTETACVALSCLKVKLALTAFSPMKWKILKQQ